VVVVPAALFGRFDDQLPGAVTAGDLQRGGQDEVTGDLAVPAGAAAAGGAAGRRWDLWSASFSRRLITPPAITVDLRC
jgi:hypothetical protein